MSNISNITATEIAIMKAEIEAMKSQMQMQQAQKQAMDDYKQALQQSIIGSQYPTLPSNISNQHSSALSPHTHSGGKNNNAYDDLEKTYRDFLSGIDHNDPPKKIKKLTNMLSKIL